MSPLSQMTTDPPEVTIRFVILLTVIVGLGVWVGIIVVVDRDGGSDGQISDRLRRHEQPGPLADEAERWLRGQMPR